MAYADDLIANSQGFAQRQQAAFDGAKASADAAYDRTQTQAGQRDFGAGDYAGAIASLANVPGSLQAVAALKDRQTGVASQLMALQGDRQGAMAAAAQTGDPQAVQAAGATAGAEQAYHLGFLLRAAHMVSQIPAQPSDAQGDPNTPRAQAIGTLAQHLTSAGMPGDMVAKLQNAPKDDTSLAQFVQGLTPLYNGTVHNADGSTADYVNGVKTAEGRAGPVLTKPGETATDPVTGRTIASTPSAPMSVAPGDGVYDPASGRMVATQPKPLETVTTAPGATTTTFNPTTGELGGGAPAAASGGGQFAPQIAAAEQKYGLPAGLLSGVINQGEASGVNAVSPKGAIGIAQLMPGTAAELGVDPRDPAQAIDGAARYLAQNLKRFGGDPAKAVAAYNAGPGAVAAHGGVPDYPETQAYVGRVLPGGHTVQGKSPQLGVTIPGLPGKYDIAPDGTASQVAGTAMTVKDALDVASKNATNPEFQQAQAAMTAYKAMTANATKMTGPSAYAMLDTFARAINPGAVARPQVIQTIESQIGVPAQVLGHLLSVEGRGNLPVQTRQQILDAVLPFVQTHWDQANALNTRAAAIARHHGVDVQDATEPLDPRPQRAVIADSAPPLASRQTGVTYLTPRGAMTWTGSAWRPAT